MRRLRIRSLKKYLRTFSLHVMNLVIKIRRRHTRNGHNTHLVSESLFGAKPTLGWTGSLSGTGRVGGGRHRGPWTRNTATAGPQEPRDRGEEGHWAPWEEGQGPAVPRVPSFKHLGVETPSRHGAQSAAGRPTPFRTIVSIPVGGEELEGHTAPLLKGPVEDSIWHLCSSILGQHEQGRGGGRGTLRRGRWAGEEAWLGRRIRAGGPAG